MQEQMVSLEYTVGQFHSLAVLVPILFLTCALICDLFHSFGYPRAFTIGHWCVIIGWIACMPAILTGLEAGKSFAPENELLKMHHWQGFALGILASLYAGLRISAMLWTLPISKNWYLGMSILLLAFVSWTSDYGVLLSNR